MNMRPSWIEPEAMSKLGYNLISNEDGYLKYSNIGGKVFSDYGAACKGKRTIYFNTNYTDTHVFMGIKEDSNTRTVFNGVIDSEITMKLIIEACR